MLAALRDAFETAAGSCAGPLHAYRIAGANVTVHAASGSAAATVSRAFEGWRGRAPDTGEDLEVFVFDGARDGFTPPASPILMRNDAPGGALGAFHGSGLHAFHQPDAGVLSLYDHARQRGYVWYRRVADLPYYEYAAPLKHILQWWMVARGGLVLHSAAVGIDGGGVLIVGPSGSGKSTTALACLDSPLRFASDDYVAVDCRGVPTVHALYSTAKVLRTSLDRHPRIAGHFRNLERLDEKPMLFVHEFAPERLIGSFPLKALLAPVIANAPRTRFAAASPAAVARALAPSSVMLFPLAGAIAFARIAQLCRTLPAFEVRLGTDPEEIAAAMSAFVSELTGRLAAPVDQCA